MAGVSERPWADFARTGPDTLVGRYLRRFWQPVALAQHVAAGRAIPLRIMGEEFALYRGQSGQAYVVSNRCAHRGTRLSTGWIEEECIRCLYHGWKYDGAGRCVEQPAEDESFAARVHIRSCPAQEYLGLIFVYFGESQAPPLPHYPMLAGGGVRQVNSYARPCNYFQSLENQVDEAHVVFTHRKSGFSRYGMNRDVPEIWANETDYGLVQYGRRPGGAVRSTHCLMPNAVYLKDFPTDTSAGWSDLIVWRVPVDDENHLSFTVRRTNVTGESAEAYRARYHGRAAQLSALPSANEMAEAVLRGELHIDEVESRADLVYIQDYVTQVGQGPIADREQERLGRSDVAIILLRRIWERELRALAEGRPLKDWAIPGELEAATGI